MLKISSGDTSLPDPPKPLKPCIPPMKSLPLPPCCRIWASPSCPYWSYTSRLEGSLSVSKAVLMALKAPSALGALFLSGWNFKASFR